MLDDIGIEGVHVPAGNFHTEDLKQLGAFGVARANVGVSCLGKEDSNHGGENSAGHLEFRMLAKDFLHFLHLRMSAWGE
jgi:hypothetical protein